MIHMHVGPITPKSVLEEMCCNSFLVSHWEPRDAKYCLEHGQMVAFDNGAFSAHNSGKPITDWNPYFSWLEDKLYQPHFAFVPDVIGGTLEDQRKLEKEWPYHKRLSAPVYHFGEDLDRIRELCDNWPRFAVAGPVGKWSPGSDTWLSIVDSIWDVIEKSNAYPWVHMMRAHSQASVSRHPWSSADSSNWARNHHHYEDKWGQLHKVNRVNPEVKEDANLDLFK